MGRDQRRVQYDRQRRPSMPRHSEGQCQVSRLWIAPSSKASLIFHNVTEPAAIALIDKLQTRKHVRLARELGAPVPHSSNCMARSRWPTQHSAGTPPSHHDRSRNQTCNRRAQNRPIQRGHPQAQVEVQAAAGPPRPARRPEPDHRHGPGEVQEGTCWPNTARTGPTTTWSTSAPGCALALPKRDNPADDITVPRNATAANARHSRRPRRRSSCAPPTATRTRSSNGGRGWGRGRHIHTEWADANVADVLIDAASGAAFIGRDRKP